MDREWLKFGNSFCPLAFLHYHLDTNKRKRLCCDSADTIDQSTGYNTEQYKIIRQKMLDNQPVAACDYCQKNEDKKLISLRQMALSNMKQNPDEIRLLQSQIEKHRRGEDLEPYWYDLRMSNNCNLACQICKPSASSTIAKNMGLADPYLMLEVDLDINPNAEKIALAGGEPFLIKKFVKMLESVENPDCDISVITNGTIISQGLITQLNRFKNVCISVSIDGIGELNERLRKNSAWDEIDRNIDRFMELGYAIRFSTAVQKDNINHLHEIADYMASKGIDDWSLIEVIEPEEFNWRRATDISKSRLEELRSLPMIQNNIQSLRFIKHVLDNV